MEIVRVSIGSVLALWEAHRLALRDLSDLSHIEGLSKSPNFEASLSSFPCGDPYSDGLASASPQPSLDHPLNQLPDGKDT